jgi:excisionase family DNA binding protein
MKKSQLSQQESTESPQNDAMPLMGLWSPRTAASFCGFQSPVTILRAFRKGRLPGYKLGLRVVRFDPKDVKQWIEAGRVG